LKIAFTLLRPGGLLLLFDYDLLPIQADETTPLSAQAWHDAFSKSMKKAGMPLFGLDKVLPCFGGMEVEGKDMRVPIGHGDGASLSILFCLTEGGYAFASPFLFLILFRPRIATPQTSIPAGSRRLIPGRMGQLGKIHYINTKAFLEAARHVMIEYGEYTDAEVDVLCKSLFPFKP
jgi:hypothetical protein